MIDGCGKGGDSVVATLSGKGWSAAKSSMLMPGGSLTGKPALWTSGSETSSSGGQRMCDD